MNDTESYYSTHSVFSNPGNYKDALSVFSSDIATMCEQVSQLFMHYTDADFLSFPIDKNRYSEFNLRYMDSILAKIFHYDASPLSKSRALPHRVLGVCRDSALLCCAILRSRNIPARLTAGYVNYYIPKLFLDSFFLEYFDKKSQRWKIVDIRTTQKHIEHFKMNIDFDFLDMPADRFMPAAHAWNLCRTNQIDPNCFGSRFFKGMLAVKNHLVHALALANKKETLVWDIWGTMLNREIEDYTVFDELSQLLLEHPHDIQKINDFYDEHTELQLTQRVMMDNPFMPEKWVELRENDFILLPGAGSNHRPSD